MNCNEYRCKVIFATARPAGSEARVMWRAFEEVNYCSNESKLFLFLFNTILFDEIMCVAGRELMSCCLEGLGNPLFQ